MLNATIKRETLVALYEALKNCRPPCDVVVSYDNLSLRLACVTNKVEEDREEGCFVWCAVLPKASFIDYTFDESDNTPPIRLDPAKVFSLFDVVKGYEEDEEVRICLVQEVVAIATSTCQNYTELEGVNFERTSFYGSMLRATLQPTVANDLVCNISRQKLVDLITAAAGLSGKVEVDVTHSRYQTRFTVANVTELVVHGNGDDHHQNYPIVGLSSFIVDTYVLKAIQDDDVEASIVVSGDAAYYSYLVLHYNGFKMQILYVEPGSGEDDPQE